MSSPVDAMSPKANFQLRANEIDQYFVYLKKIDKTLKEIAINRNQKRKYNLPEDLYKTLKANSFILLYNLIESSINEILAELYVQMNSENIPYSELVGKLKNQWLHFQFIHAFDVSSNIKTYEAVARRVLDTAIQNKSPILDKKMYGISGNLTADKIYQICDVHGVSKKVHPKADSGNPISTIKDNRNALAHGYSSFSECGRQYTFGDLDDYRLQTFYFIKSIINNFEKYKKKHKYRIS